MNSSTSSGMLRKTSTYTPPIRWTHGDGATRSAATRVPTPMAMRNARPTSRTVTQNPDANWSKFSVRTSSRSATRRFLGPELERLVERHLGRLLLLLRVLADPLVVGLLPAAVLLPLLDDLGDEALELRVLVLDAGAVGLRRELLALDELERVVLDDHAGEDHVVGRDRVDRAVLDELDRKSTRLN